MGYTYPINPIIVSGEDIEKVNGPVKGYKAFNSEGIDIYDVDLADPNDESLFDTLEGR